MKYHQLFRALITIALLIPCLNLKAAHFTLHVSPNGRDSNEGSAASPLRTLEAAQQAVRSILEDNAKSDIDVILYGGKHVLENTFVLGLADSPAEGHRLTFKAAKGQRPVLCSDYPVSGWKKIDVLPEHFPAVANGKLWVADVPKGFFFKALFDGDDMLPRARSRGFIPNSENVTSRKNHWMYRDTIRFPESAIRDWENLEDVELFTRTNQGYIANYLPLKKVDEENLVAYTAIPGTYRLSAGKEAEHGGINSWIENVPEALDEPGEWVLNSRTSKLYYWPIQGDKPSARIVAPRLKEYILIQGEVTDALTGDKPVKNISLDGLTFTRGARDSWTAEDKGVQHDWGMWDKGNSLVRLRGAENCEILNSTFFNSAGGAIRLDRYAQHNRISRNEIHHVGESAIFLCGYGAGKKDVNKHNAIDNNHIWFTSELWWQTPSILISQSGQNVVRNNRLHDSPYALLAITGVRPRFFGIWGIQYDKLTYEQIAEPNLREQMRIIRWDETGPFTKATQENYFHILNNFCHAGGNLVQDNEFHNGNEMLGDGNPVYYSCSGGGNIFRRNVIYNSRGAGQELRLDDDQYDTQVVENIFITDQSRGGLRVKHNNEVDNNILVNGAVMYGSNNREANTLTHNIFYRAQPDFKARNGIGWKGSAEKYLPKFEALDNNLYAGSTPPDYAAMKKQFELQQNKKIGGEGARLVKDPGFVDFKNFDLRLKPGSPALEIGIRSIDIDQIGLQEDPTFPRFRKAGKPAYENKHSDYIDVRGARGKYPTSSQGKKRKSK